MKYSKKYIIILISIISISAYFLIRNTRKGQNMSEYVYVCRNGKSKVYHKKNCEGLSWCTHKVETMTEMDAKKRGRKRCRYCF